MKSITLWPGDCKERLKEIPNDSIDLVVTSPPYDNLRSYKWTITVYIRRLREGRPGTQKGLKRGGRYRLGGG